jgi:hypothetical protein
MSEINHFKVFLVCKMMWQVMFEGRANVACFDRMLIWHICMSREFHVTQI